MNVEQLTLKNFKRFTDLTIDLTSCQPVPKLVLLIGANGSGKSSVFDAFEHLSASRKPFRWLSRLGDAPSMPPKASYFAKGSDAEVACRLGGGFEIRRLNNGPAQQLPNSWNVTTAFYGRSSFRTIPELRAGMGDAGDPAKDRDRPRRFIDRDLRFEADIARMTEDVLREVWGTDFNSETMKARFTAPINDALARVFGNSSATALELTRMVPALGDKPPDIRFRKGRSDIHYDLLSSGEKEVFNILLNLFSRREHFPNAIYFIDEMDVHLHTRLQFALVREVVEQWIPAESQLWTASHSLGFIEYAHESEEAVILDFDDLDFDRQQLLQPSPPSEHVFDIAVPADSTLKVFPNQKLVLCENDDASVYNAVGLPGLLFVGARDKNAVGLQVGGDDRFLGLIDRDFLGSEEITMIRGQRHNLFVLRYYAVENYLFHPSNLAELALPEFDENHYRVLLGDTMKSIRDRLLVNLERSRNSYEIIKTLSREIKGRAQDEVAQATASDDFETFYPFLNMKSHRPTSYLAQFNLSRPQLAKTLWLRNALATVLP